MSTETRTNRFSEIVNEVQKAPQNQRVERLIDGIASQMQQSTIGQTQQLGEELVSAKGQLLRALQQQGG
jgi:hypothetical protein